MTATLGLLVISPENAKTLAIAVVLLTACISAACVLYPMARGWARQLEGRSAEEGSGERIDELNARVIDLERQASRMQELEERLDFTERLLARQQGLRLTPGQREDEL